MTVLLLLLACQDPAEVRRATGFEAGLVVHLGTTDGALEAAFADGRSLVHGIALEDPAPARRRLRTLGVYGLASVMRRPSIRELPYADDLVNLLIADLDRLGGPAEEELLRVLAPGGSAYVRRGGRWETLRKRRPPEIDDWTHAEYGPQGNAVSGDRRAGPVTTLRWIDGYRWVSYAHNESTGFRSENGILVHEFRFEREGQLVGRDAFNGLVRWRIPRESAEHGLPMVLAEGTLWTHLGSAKGVPLPLVGLDLRTGERRGVVEEAEPIVPGGREAFKRVRELAFGGRLYQAAGKRLRAFDLKTRRLLWTYEDGRNLLFPVGDPAEGKIFMVAEREGGRSAWTRWPGAEAEAIVAVDAATGRALWRREEVGGEGIGVLACGEGRLLAVQTSGIGAFEPVKGKGFVAVLRAADGTLLWRRDYRQDHPKGSFPGFLFQGMIRDGRVYLLNQNRALPYDLETGRPEPPIDPPTVNNRCVRPRATVRYLLLGFGLFVDREGRFTFQNVARSDCATGVVPANGMIYTTPNDCHCFAQLRGFAGYAPAPPPREVPDEERLEREGGRPEPGGAVPAWAPVETVTVKNDLRKLPPRPLRKRRTTDSPIRDAWHNNDALPYPEGPEAVEGPRRYVPVVHEHRLEAREGDRVVWSFTADARVSGAPVVKGGRVYFGSHDGSVYCLNASDGALQWRFLAAPGHRWIAAYGQLESSWPVPAVVAHQGDLWLAAGRHPELDGGIVVYRLDPESGRIRSKKTLHRGIEWASPGSAAFRGLQNVVLNEGLRVVDGSVRLFGHDLETLSSPTRTYKGEIPIER